MARKVLPLSWFASNGAANSPTDAIVDRRRDDYGFWQDLVATMPGVMPVMPGLGDGVCPLGFPVVSRERDAWKRRLERAGLPVTIHWRLPPGADDGCANSHRLSSQMITLPVFPHLTAEARARMRHVAAEGWHL
jgi:dTDP-4-amino-4,6-dideoxygalactose transaminase